MRVLKRTTVALTALATAAVLVSPGTADAAAGQKKWSRTLNDSVIAPYQIALNRGHVYYTDGFAGTINKVTPGDDQVVASVQGELTGVEFTPDGKTMAFTSSTQAGSTLTIRRAGRPDVVADLGTYESTVNPDRKQTYGIQGYANQCAKDFFAQITELDPTYQGQVDSHPYQVGYLGRGAWAVADAGGNDIVKVDATGHISTLALLPPAPYTFTKATAAAVGAPECIAGVTYRFEGVPTDVERDQHGNLWVSSLPGGPEDDSLGARGSVFKISGRSVKRFATGFVSATNVAVTPGGTLYVAELFGNKVTRVFQHRKATVVRLDRSLAVEVLGRYLYVGQFGDLDFETGEVNAPGAIIKYRR